MPRGAQSEEHPSAAWNARKLARQAASASQLPHWLNWLRWVQLKRRLAVLFGGVSGLFDGALSTAAIELVAVNVALNG